jgi:hypothetical protein
MASDGNNAAGANPAEQITQTMQAVTQVLKTAGERAVAGNQELAQCAMKQAQQNVSDLFRTLQTMATSRDPAQITTLYTQFVTESAQKHAQQLQEIGQLMAKSSQEAWGPVVQALSTAATRSPSGI